MKQLLDRAISALPENYRSLILLRDVEGLSTMATAQILDLAEDVVKTRLHRAHLAVRQSWMKTCGPMAGFCPVTVDENEDGVA